MPSSNETCRSASRTHARRAMRIAGRFAEAPLSVQTIGTRARALKFGVRAAASLVLAVALAVTAIAFEPGAPTALAADRVDSTTPKKLGVPASALPEVDMPAGQLVTADGRVLWSRKGSEERAMASLTKIMTAVVALENSEMDEVVTIGSHTAEVGESTSFLRPGQKIEMSALLEALLVKSGNDAGVAVAEHVGGSEKRFVAMMNDKAGELGLSATHFANAHGLDAKGHHSSAEDLAVLARYAMSDARFRKIVKKKAVRVKRGGQTLRLENTNLLLGNYEGANGVKTGWTGDAGYCLVASARRDGIELYAVVLGTRSEQERFAESKVLLDWGFAHYREQHLVSAGTVVGQAVVTDYLDVKVDGAVSRDTTLAVFDLAGPIERSVAMASVRAPVEKGERVGVATFTQRGRVVATVPLVASHAVEKPGFFERIGIGIVRLWRRVFGGSQTAAQTAVRHEVSC